MAAAILAGCGAPTSESAAQSPTRYDLTYTVTPLPREQAVEVELNCSDPGYLLARDAFAIGGAVELKVTARSP